MDTPTDLNESINAWNVVLCLLDLFPEKNRIESQKNKSQNDLAVEVYRKVTGLSHESENGLAVSIRIKGGLVLLDSDSTSDGEEMKIPVPSDGEILVGKNLCLHLTIYDTVPSLDTYVLNTAALQVPSKWGIKNGIAVH